MVFSKKLSLPFGAKSLLLYQVDLSKEESPLPIRGKRVERRTRLKLYLVDKCCRRIEGNAPGKFPVFSPVVSINYIYKDA